jgi:hypothetical protein
VLTEKNGTDVSNSKILKLVRPDPEATEKPDPKRIVPDAQHLF